MGPMAQRAPVPNVTDRHTNNNKETQSDNKEMQNDYNKTKNTHNMA